MMVELLVLLFVVLLFVVAVKLVKALVKLAWNSIIGLIILGLLNLFGFGIDINIWTVLITAVGGVVGVFIILILHFLGIAF